MSVWALHFERVCECVTDAVTPLALLALLEQLSYSVTLSLAAPHRALLEPCLT